MCTRSVKKLHSFKCYRKLGNVGLNSNDEAKLRNDILRRRIYVNPVRWDDR